MSTITTVNLNSDIKVVSFQEEETSHLIVCNNKSLLIDCHDNQLKEKIIGKGLPLPRMILHTHVQPEHCKEGNSLDPVTIIVPKGLENVASNSSEYKDALNTVWDNPGDWPKTYGQERYGLCGTTMYYPPETPIRVDKVIEEGETIEWDKIQLKSISLPIHGSYSLGYILQHKEATLAVFIGDLFRHPSCLVNVYSMAVNYLQISLLELPTYLDKIASYETELLFPSTGPVIEQGKKEIGKLREKISSYLESLEWKSDLFKITELPEYGIVNGRYELIHDGVFQINNSGNTILFIDQEGRGLVIDPGPCDYGKSLHQRASEFHEELQGFEEDFGLKKIEVAVITHFHGDHIDLTHVLKERYGTVVAAWNLVADVIERPEDFPYSCLLPWYNLEGLDKVIVQDRLQLSEPYYWNDIRIDTIHQPGHAYAHAAYIIGFNGKRFALTGDTVQNRGDASTLEFVITNHSAPGEHGNLKAFQELLKYEIDINLGGHGSKFINCKELYQESVRRIEYATKKMESLIYKGNFNKAFIPPYFPDFNY